MPGRDVSAGRLSSERIQANFGELQPALTQLQAVDEAARCLYCYDAPCTEACPTGIDIPGFIRAISSGNTTGAAMLILGENIMGGTCANVCPVEELCEQVCVRNTAEERPVAIGRLQRYATDHLFASRQQPFQRSAPTGRRVAVVGAGPAGLSCAHALAIPPLATYRDQFLMQWQQRLHPASFLPLEQGLIELWCELALQLMAYLPFQSERGLRD